MSYQAYFDLQDGIGYRDVSAYIANDSLVVTTRAFNEAYAPAQNTATFKLVYDETLYNLLLAQTKDILVRITKTEPKYIVTENGDNIVTENGDKLVTEPSFMTRLFQGHMTPSYERTYNGIMYATQLSCSAEDDLSYLDTPIADPDVLELIGGVVYTDCKVCDPSNPTNSIVHKLAAIKGLSVSSTCSIPTVIAKFAPDKETDTIKDVMAKLLYEYGHTLYIDQYGLINPVLYRKPSSATAEYTFSDANIIKEVSITETVQDYDGAYVTYYESKKAEKIRLYTDDNCGYNDDGTFAGYDILSGYKYPIETNAIDDTTGTWTKVYQEYTDEAIKYWTNKAVVNNLDYNYKAFSSDFSSIIATENHFQNAKVADGIVADITTEYYNKKCRIIWKNPTPTSLKLYYNNVYGDVYYRGVAKKLKVYREAGVKPVNPYEYSMQFVFDENNATIFTGFLSAQYISCRHTKYTLTSEAQVNVGAFVNITLGDGTNQACIVMSDEHDFTEEQHKYILISVATTALAISAKDTSVTVTADNTYSYGSIINVATTSSVSEAVTAATAEANAYTDGIADALQGDIDGKITTYYQASAPTTGMTDGDIWIDSDDGNNQYRYNGTSWVDVQDTGIAAAYNLANTKITTWYQASAPTTGMSTGDIWIDTDDGNNQYRYSGTAWVDIQDTGIVAAYNLADSKITTWYQSDAPTTGLSSGDIWIDTDAGNNQYLYFPYTITTETGYNLVTETGAPITVEWVDIQDATIYDAYSLANSKRVTWATLALAQASAVAGDYFLDNSLLYNATMDGANISIANSVRLTPKSWGNLSTAPASGMITGDTYYNTNSVAWYTYTGSAWTIDGTGLTDAITAYTPIYRGKWLDTEPTTSVNGDWYTRYSATSGTNNRGVFYKNSSGVWTRTTDSRYVGSGAINDIINICANSTYGTVADYGATYVQDLFSQYLKILTGGSLYGGNRYNADGSDYDTGSAGFWLGANGVLKAASGSFTGAVTATSGSFTGSIYSGAGTIGGCTIDTAGIYSGSGSAVAGLGLSGSRQAFWAGAAAGSSGSAPFRVDHSGNLTATSANIAGAITATSGTFNGTVNASAGSFTGSITSTSGTIGGCTIDGAGIWSGSTAQQAGLGLYGSRPAFWAGGTDPNTSAFRVGHDGSLIATNANITGAVTATSGSFTGAITAQSGSFTGSVSVGSGGAIYSSGRYDASGNTINRNVPGFYISGTSSYINGTIGSDSWGNTLIGTNAGINLNTTTGEEGKYNTIVGGNVGGGAVGATYCDNSIFGYNAGYSLTTGSGNCCVGFTAGYSLTTGGENSFFGKYAGDRTTTGGENSFFGNFTGGHNTTGRGNVFIGMYAGDDNTAGSYNIAIGRYSGAGASTLNNGVYIGNNTSCNTYSSSTQINLNNRFRCFEFPIGSYLLNIYFAFAEYVLNGYTAGAMGNYGASNIYRISRSDTTITFMGASTVLTVSSANTTETIPNALYVAFIVP